MIYCHLLIKAILYRNRGDKMYIQDNGKTRKLIADEGKKLTNSDRNFFADFIYLCKNDAMDNYEEVPRAIWKHYVEEKNSDMMELRSQIEDLEYANDELGELLLETDYRLLKLQIYGVEEI